MIFIKSILIMTSLFLSCVNSQEYRNKSHQFPEVRELIEKAIDSEIFPGAVLLIWKDGEILLEEPYGHLMYEKSSPPVITETIYDIASLTKVIATTTASMICIEKGKFSLDDKVTKFIPEFRNNNKEKITIRNLLLHNSGLPAWKKYFSLELNKEQILNDIFSSSLDYPTGTKMVYSDLGIITLGRIIEIVSGTGLDDFCSKEIFQPLGMNSTFFNPPDSLVELCAPTEYDNYWRRRLIRGEVHDETASLLNGIAGHAGLFSTANDLSKLVAMIMNKGIYNEKIFIKYETIKNFITKQSDKSTRALGWDTKSEKGSSAGDLFSINSFGHTGFTGTSIWADSERNLFVVFLTNRVYPSRENTKIISFRPELHNKIIKSIEHLHE